MVNEQLQGVLLRLQGGDREAGQELTQCLSPLVNALARRFACGYGETEDYYQVGMIGLLKAARRFDPALQVKFTTFAVSWIKGEMLSYKRRFQSPVKLSRSLWEQSRALSLWRERLVQQLNREPVLSELAQAMGTTVEEIAVVMDAAQPLASLEDDPPAAREGASQEEDLLDRLLLQDGMMKLSPLERRIIMLRFFKEKTQAEIGELLFLSQRQVSRLEKRILRQLRQHLQH